MGASEGLRERPHPKHDDGISLSSSGPPASRWQSKEDLIGYKDLLNWQKDNEFILTGYRPASFSYQRSFSSVCRLHNETINIWSHGLGSLAFSLIPLAFFLSWSDVANFSIDSLMLAVFFASVTICFLFSTAFHILLNHSPAVWETYSKLDHLGIVLVIWGSTVPSAHFGFHDEKLLRDAYWALATFAAAGSAYATLQPFFRTSQGRRIRVFLYCLLGISAFASAVHGVLRHGYELQDRRMSLSYFIGLGLLNFTGAAIYAIRVPERLCPRLFDIFGSSHQVMHVLVMFGALSHTIGLLQAYRYWYTAP